MDEEWQRFTARFQMTLAAQLEGKPEAFKALWSHGSDVSILEALGGPEHGWTEVGLRLDWASGQVRASDLRLENILTVVGTDMAVTVDLERMVRTVDGKQVPRVLRCTQVYRIEGWRVEDLPPSRRRATAGGSLRSVSLARDVRQRRAAEAEPEHGREDGRGRVSSPRRSGPGLVWAVRNAVSPRLRAEHVDAARADGLRSYAAGRGEETA